MMGLNSLNMFKKNTFEPDNLNMLRYVFFEKGIDLNQFNELPIPYIMEMFSTLDYFKRKEEEAYKKANKK
jgi:hypothetical protein